MNLEKIIFENYKAFSTAQVFEIRPLTLLIGKNSSGKSSIAKLFTLLANSLSGEIIEPLQLVNNNVALGAEFLDLVYNRIPSVPVKFELAFEGDVKLAIEVVQQVGDYSLTIFAWSYNSPKFNLTLSIISGSIYKDSTGKQYQCIFNGFLPVSIKTVEGQELVGQMDFDMAIDVDYIGPFRVLPERQFHLTGRIFFERTGIKGENAYPMLGASKMLKDELHEQVGDWFEKNLTNWRLVVEDRNRPFIELKLIKGPTEVNIVDVGQGMNQVLPLVVRALQKRERSITIIEQPELHLHPAAHGDLGELFVQSSMENNQRFIIETHSENILLRLRKLVIDEAFGIKPEDVIIYWVDDNGAEGHQVKDITMDAEGILTDWPPGVFNENITEIQEMRKAVARRRERVGE